MEMEGSAGQCGDGEPVQLSMSFNSELNNSTSFLNVTVDKHITKALNILDMDNCGDSTEAVTSTPAKTGKVLMNSASYNQPTEENGLPKTPAREYKRVVCPSLTPIRASVDPSTPADLNNTAGSCAFSADGSFLLDS